MKQPISLSRHGSLPLIASIPIAILGVVFTVLFALIALIPDGLDEGVRTLGTIFYTFIFPFLLIAAPLMSFLLRRSMRNRAIFDREAVILNEMKYEFSAYDLVYYPICLGNYLRYRPGLLVLRSKGWEGYSEDVRPKEIEVGFFTSREMKRLAKLGLTVQKG